jgi:hypothetical protein
MLSILAMVSAVDMNAKPQKVPLQKGRLHDEPLRMDAAEMKTIHDEIAPYLRRGQVLESETNSDRETFGGRRTKHISRQLRWKDEMGVWRVTEA